MKRVLCTIFHTKIENDNGRTVTGVRAECSLCGHETESFGTSENSIRRCLALMREECLRCEDNFYVDEDDE